MSFREDDSYSLNLAPITVQVGPFLRPGLYAAAAIRKEHR